MSTFTQYLTESAKQYDYKIKVAGDLDKDFADKLETALGKFDVAKFSAGKSYPIQETPLDFPQFKNTNVTIFDATTNYPVSAFEIQRNNVIEGAQGNRNPFIDNPYLATLIWGGNPAENKWN